MTEPAGPEELETESVNVTGDPWIDGLEDEVRLDEVDSFTTCATTSVEAVSLPEPAEIASTSVVPTGRVAVARVALPG